MKIEYDKAQAKWKVYTSGIHSNALKSSKRGISNAIKGEVDDLLNQGKSATQIETILGKKHNFALLNPAPGGFVTQEYNRKQKKRRIEQRS